MNDGKEPKIKPKIKKKQLDDNIIKDKKYLN